MVKVFCTLLVVIFLPTYYGFAQNDEQCNTCDIIEMHDEKAWSLRKTYPDSTIYYTDLIIDQMKNEGDTSLISKYYNYKGIGYYYKGDNYSSFGYYIQAYETAEALGDSIQFAHSLNNLGRFFLSQGNYVKSFEYSNQALAVFESLNYQDGIAFSQKRISEVYLAQGYLDKALLASKQVLKIRLDHFDVNTQSTAHIDLAYLFLEMDSLKQSRMQFVLATKKAIEINNTVLIANIDLGLSDLNIKLNNYDSAIIYAQKAKKEALKINNQDLLNRAIVQLGKSYFFATLILEANKEFELILEKSRSSNQLQFQRDAFYYLAKINAKIGQGMKAYEYQLQFDSLSKKLNNIKDKRAIDSLLFEDEIELRAKENRLLVINKEKDQELILSQKKKNNLMIVTILSILAALGIIFRNTRKTKRDNQLLRQKNGEILAQKEEISSNLEKSEELEKKLLSSNQRLESVLNSGYVSIISTTTEGVITHFSKGAENLLGYQADEMIAKQTPAIIHDMEEVIQRGKELSGKLNKEISGFDVFITVADRDGFESREWTYIKKNGDKFPVQLVVSALKDENGIADGYLGIATDITQQKNIEEQLRQIVKVNEHYKDILENVEDFIYELDGKGDYIYVNPATCRISGYTSAELLTMNFLDLIPEEQRKGVIDFYDKQSSDKIEITSREFIVKNKNGAEIWVRQTTRMFFDKSGQLIRILAVAQNINEIHELRLKLDTQYEQYKLISENSQDLIALHDLNGNYLYVSPSVENLLGYKPKDLIGKNPYEFIHKDDHEKLKQGPHQNTIKGKAENNIEYRVKNKTGKYLWFEAYTSPVFNDKNEVISLQTSSRDITQRLKIQTRILQSEANLRALIDNTTDIIYTIDLDNKLLTYNNSFRKGFYLLYGIKLGKGQKVDDAYPDSSTKELWLSNIKRVKSGERLITTMNYTGRDKKAYTYEYHYNPIINEGAVLGVSIFGRDISEKQKQEEKVKRYQEGLRLINSLAATTSLFIDELLKKSLQVVAEYLNLPLGIISTINGDEYTIREFYSKEDNDLEKGQIFEFKNTYCDLTYKNEGVISISDMSSSEYNGHPCFENFGLQTYIGAIIYVDNKKTGTVNFSSPKIRIDDFDELDEDFMILYANWIGANIETYNVNKQLRLEKEKAEKASQAKVEFLSVMSHEIRTPLNGILGLTNFLLTENPRQDQIKNLNLLKFSGDNLLVIINDILDYNKIEAGKIILEQTDFNLQSLMSSIHQTNSFKTVDKNFDFIFEYDDKLPLVFLGDPVRIGQVINNLVSNAIKFTKKGYVKLTAKLVKLSGNKVEIQISVVDTGKGIDPSKHNLIFEQFSQEEESTTRQFGGTGLGLSISKKLLSLMNSKIELESEPNKGSKFHFKIKLPLGQENLVESSKLSTKKINSLAPFKIKALVADDNDLNFMITRKYLEQWGVSSEHASDGAIAVDMALNGDFDIVLMDLEMPNMNGYEAAKKINEVKGKLPILALTASVLEEVRIKAKEAGMNDFITKPITQQDLYNKLVKNVPININDSKPINIKKEIIELDGIEEALNSIAMGDRDFKNKLIELYIDNFNEFRIKFTEAFNSEDLIVAEAIAHKMKASILTLNIKMFNNMVETGMKYIKSKQSKQNKSFVDEISNQCSIVVEKLKSSHEN